ncbi:LysR family transcriptional regulator [Neobacillus vireti]|uniref:Transcriptional regulator n=1 Tax=Neobacillus vireti LMG 21834 TaxID=1131730 RepID=A0AB94IQ79_9BACI|nr:LysR family transcriptional regulator [Neobacillus vireti]ETI69220.1 transcriptional regulator [Neobacillus vireti LMG 21834]KLT18960.1 LysR family transcriptional regulator [Neobacillus vireti]
MEDRDWVLLQALYKHKNITRAAQELFISQPSLTKRLQDIEKEFGATIVQRGRRGVQFTPEGEFLAKSADEILRNLRMIKEHVQNMGTNVIAGTLRLGVSDYFTKYQLPRILKLFKNQYQNVEFQVKTGWSKDVLNLVHNQDVHIGFLRGDYQWTGKKHLLFEETLCIAYKDEFELKDLPRLPRIDYRTESLFKGMIDNWWTANFEQPPFVGMMVDKVDTCKEMIINGLGYAIVPRFILNDVQDLYLIDIKDKKGNPLLRKTWMYYHEDALEMKMVKLFVDLVESLDLSTTQ